MNLEKMLQSQGFGSRKYCQQLIKSGDVKILNEVITDPKHKLKLENLEYEVSGDQFVYREKVYIALNKPAGYECSHQATHHFSVYDLIDPLLLNRGVQTVGRLDQDTTGIVLLTDDGQFLQALTHPKKHVPKVYQMITADSVTEEQIQQLQNGVELKNENGIFHARDVKLLAEKQLQFTVHQGVYHQVKRMVAAVGNRVETLHRLQIGQLKLEQLASGKYSYLDETQILAARNQLVSINDTPNNVTINI